MSDYSVIPKRIREQNLLIVEGEHEKNKLFQLILAVYPELDISIENIVIYKTNIYDLYNQILEEYKEEWYRYDVDVAFIVSKKLKFDPFLKKNSFNNIFLIFDYEHHDPNFSEFKIERMQTYFSDSEDMGKLYINYPMIESYQHHTQFPDITYNDLKVKVSLQPGFEYKKLVQKKFIFKLINLPEKIEKLLSDKFHFGNVMDCKKFTQKLLSISNLNDLLAKINEIPIEALSDSEKKQIYNWLKSKEYIKIIKVIINICVRYLSKLLYIILIRQVRYKIKVPTILELRMNV